MAWGNRSGITAVYGIDDGCYCKVEAKGVEDRRTGAGETAATGSLAADGQSKTGDGSDFRL
jgi:hypothetical protein